MDEHVDFTDGDLEAIAFAGDTIAPFFLQDPERGSATSLYGAFAVLDAAEAARDWPFGDGAQLERGFSLMASGLSEGVNADVTWEYRRLFVGPGHKAAAPWGSVYTDYEGVIFGRSTLDLRAWMRANGIARLSDEGDPEDHIGLLLLMMAWIARHRPDLLRDFLRLHLLTWSSHYLGLLQERAEHPFFEGLAVLTRATLEGIQSTFAIDVEYPRFFR